MTSEASSKDFKLSYKLFHGGQLAREELLEVDSITIGRASNNVILLDDDQVSDLHAVVKVTRDRQLQLTDLGSDLGTFVGDERVDMRVQVSSGARIRVGAYDIQLELVDLTRRAVAAHTSHEDLARLEGDRVLDEDGEMVIRLLFDAWNRQDRLGVDNKTAPRVLEVFEVWGDTILSAKQYERTVSDIMLANHSTSKPEFVIDREFLPAEEISLVTQRGNQMQLVLGPGYEGHLWRDTRQQSLQELISSGEASKTGELYYLPLTDDCRFVVKFGHIMLVGGFAFPAKRPAALSQVERDYFLIGCMLVSMLIGTSGVLYIHMLPPTPELTIEQLDDRFAKMIIPEEPKKIELEKPRELQVKTKEEEKKPEEKKPEETKVSKKDEKVNLINKRVAIDKAARDKKAAENAGLLKDLPGGGGLFGSGLGGGLEKATSGLLGTTGRSSIAGVGGSKGLGFGGGGQAEGPAGVGTRGGGGGYGDDAGLTGRKKRSGDISAGGGDTMVLGNIDKKLIDEVIRKNIGQIKFCYNRQLVKNPQLAGKIVVRFTIAADGSVSASNIKESSMGDAAVESCVNDRITSLRFPEPKGGGKAIVTYPFVFKGAG